MITDKSNGRLDEIKTSAKEHDLMDNFIETFSGFVPTVEHFIVFPC